MNNNLKLLLAFVISLAGSIFLLNVFAGLSFDIPSQAFQMYMYASVISIISTKYFNYSHSIVDYCWNYIFVGELLINNN